jgi:probable phosphoglycerate mutase
MPLAGDVLRLLVLRHGRTAWNRAGRFQGQADPPLDEVGWSQADAAARALAPLDPALIVTSDLRRARQTSSVVAGRLSCPVVADARLREIDLGGWTGLDRSAAMRRFPSEYARWVAGADLARGGGEWPRLAGRRAAAALVDHLATVPTGATLLAVSHGLVLQAALRLLVGEATAGLTHDPPHLVNGDWMTVDVWRSRPATLHFFPAPVKNDQMALAADGVTASPPGQA